MWTRGRRWQGVVDPGDSTAGARLVAAQRPSRGCERWFSAIARGGEEVVRCWCSDLNTTGTQFCDFVPFERVHAAEHMLEPRALREHLPQRPHLVHELCPSLVDQLVELAEIAAELLEDVVLEALPSSFTGAKSGP